MLMQASDIYSFGILMYEMLSGRQAWGGLSPFQIFYQVVEKQQALHWPEHIPSPLRAVAQACLAFQPAQRCSFEQVLSLLSEA
jgi:serine/threonine protein kinase